MTYSLYDVVAVPFPFTDREQTKKRPALVISSEKRFDSEHSVLAMITSAKNDPWPLDILLKDLKSAGLSAESVVRMKLFTLDHRLIALKIGHLAQKDRQAVRKNLMTLFSF